MSSKTPMIRQTAWISIIPHLAVMALIMFIWYQFNPQKTVLYGTLSYLTLSIGLRYIIPKSHREGINLVKNLKYEQALAKFEKSHQFFSDHNWIDDYRYIVLLSSSNISYGEMALCNIAFCHSQLGNGKLSKEFYIKTLKKYPDSGLAQAGLNMMNAANNQQEE